MLLLLAIIIASFASSAMMRTAASFLPLIVRFTAAKDIDRLRRFAILRRSVRLCFTDIFHRRQYHFHRILPLTPDGREGEERLPDARRPLRSPLYGPVIAAKSHARVRNKRGLADATPARNSFHLFYLYRRLATSSRREVISRRRARKACEDYYLPYKCHVSPSLYFILGFIDAIFTMPSGLCYFPSARWERSCVDITDA